MCLGRRLSSPVSTPGKWSCRPFQDGKGLRRIACDPGRAVLGTRQALTTSCCSSWWPSQGPEGQGLGAPVFGKRAEKKGG